MAKAKFDIKSLMSEATLSTGSQIKRKKIDYTQLEAHKNNHYSMSNISELADSIEDNGLLHNLVVKSTDKIDEKGRPIYTIVSGHRRSKAIREIVENRGKNEFREIDCVVLDKNEDETLTEIKMHAANISTRELTEYEKMITISELKRLISEAKQKGLPIKGRVREIISESVNLGSTQVQKYLNIAENATEETKKALERGDITVKDAYSSLSNKQENIIDEKDKNKNSSEKNGYKKIHTKLKSLKKASQEVIAEEGNQNEEWLQLISKMEVVLEEMENYINAKDSKN